ncbi:hypothetical protein EMIT0P100_120057 [Pseudomonas sp. IT-P100]
MESCLSDMETSLFDKYLRLCTVTAANPLSLFGVRSFCGKRFISGEGIYICGEEWDVWRGDLSPLGREAAPAIIQTNRLWLLRSQTGINPLATGVSLAVTCSLAPLALTPAPLCGTVRAV